MSNFTKWVKFLFNIIMLDTATLACHDRDSQPGSEEGSVCHILEPEGLNVGISAEAHGWL